MIPEDIAAGDRRLLEYLMLNWRMSLLNVYLNGGLNRHDELERAINRCSMIMNVLRSEHDTDERLQALLADQLSHLASELGDIVEDDEESEERYAWAHPGRAVAGNS